MNTNENYYSVADVTTALGCANWTARKMLAKYPHLTRPNPKNHKLERIWPQSVVLPLCVKFKRGSATPKGFLSMKDAAERAGIHPTSIYPLIRRGKLKTTILSNGQKVIDEESLNEFLTKRTASKIHKALTILRSARYIFNQLRPAIYGDPEMPCRFAEDSRALLKARLNALTTKLNELKEITA